MNAQATTSLNAVSSEAYIPTEIMPADPYPGLLRDIAYRLIDGTAERRDGYWLLQILGAYEYQEEEIERLRRNLRDARGIPQRQQDTPQQQWQARAAQDSIEHWMLAQSSDFDDFLSTAEGESWLEQQAENLADPYFT